MQKKIIINLTIFILFLLFILFYKKYYLNSNDITNENNTNNKTIENFYTLFLPFYNPETITKYNSITNQSPNQIKTFHITFYTSPVQLRFSNIKLFLKSLIAYKYPIINVNLISNNNQYYNKIENQKNTIFDIPAPILNNIYNKNSNINSNINSNYNSNLRFISSINEQYLFIIAPINKNLDTIADLDGKTIGVGEKNSLWNICANDIFNNNSGKINYNPFYGSLQLMLQKLYNGKIDAIVFTDTFPSYILNFIVYNFYNLHLIPLDKLTNMNYYYTKTSVDLTDLPSLYLPNATFKQKHNPYKLASISNNFNRIENNHMYYNPLLTTYKFSNYLITNNNMDNELAYLITKHIFNNNLMLVKSKNVFSYLPIEIQGGSKKYMIENGFMSNIDNEECIFLYGKKICNEKSLGNIRDSMLI